MRKRALLFNISVVYTLTKNKTDQIELLSIVKSILDDQHIVFWLDCGTLLGAVRDGNFIPWDKDIDLGVWNKQISQKNKTVIIKQFREKGLLINDSIHENINIRLGKFWCDINFYFVVDDKAIFHRTAPKNFIGSLLLIWANILINTQYSEVKYMIHSKSILEMILKKFLYLISVNLPLCIQYEFYNYTLSIYYKLFSKNVPWITPYKFLESFITINFYGMDFLIPKNVNEYLSYGYGKDWTIPQKNVNWLERGTPK